MARSKRLELFQLLHKRKRVYLPTPLLAASVCFAALPPAALSQTSVTHVFSDGSVASAQQVNENFQDLVTAIDDLQVYQGLFSVGLGSGVLESNSGTYNTVIGYRALTYNTSGMYNSAIGYNALHANRTGTHNTASGSAALRRNTAGNFNTASGTAALAGNTLGEYNTASGFRALYNNTTGGHNTASGVDALFSNTVGDFNTANGFEALNKNTTGLRNTAVGRGALYENTTGGLNAAVGDGALGSNVDGGRNTALGYRALHTHTRGSLNTAIGMNALFSDEEGVNNVAVGGYALDANIAGTGNTALGTYADVTSDSLENATAIGFLAQVNASNKVRIGNSNVTVIEGYVPFTSSSDARLKDSITPVSDGLALINDLNPVSYHRINNAHGDIEMGLLAQEVAATLEKHGLADSGMVHQPSEDAYMSLRYNDLLAPMIKAIQELDDAADTKDEQIASLQGQLQAQQEAAAGLREELLAIVQSQQEQIAQLQRMVEQQFAAQ